MKSDAVISNVVGIGPSDGATVTVLLDDGREVSLNSDDARSEQYASILKELKELAHPVYVEIEPQGSTITRLLVPLIGRVIAVHTVDDGLEVELDSSQSVFRLPAAATDFPGIEARLRESEKSGERVVLTDDDAHSILDVRSVVRGSGGTPPPFDIAARPLGQRPLWSWLPRPLRRLVVSPGWPWRWTSMASMINAFAVVSHRTCDPATAPAPCIPFMYPDDGCWARAHEMCRLMIDLGLPPYKVWVRSADGVRLTPSSKNHPECRARWFWHCAPTLAVRSGLFWYQRYVIDPALFNEPVTVGTWKAALNDPNATLTDSGASEYMIDEIHTYVSNLSRTDPNYTETNYYLAIYRARLMARAAEGNGPPFAYCA